MRRFLGGLAVFLGVALLVLGLTAGSLYDGLARVKLDQHSTVVSEGTGMEALRAYRGTDGASHYDRLTDATIRNTREIRGIPGQVPDDKRAKNAFWQIGVRSEAVGVGDLTMSIDGVSLDRVTGMSTNCCGDYRSAGTLDDPGKTESQQHEGLFFKFPFDAQKTSYPFWDGDLGKAVDATYQRTQTVQGVSTYVYEQRIPQAEIGQRTLPADLFGTTGADVSARVLYANVRTFWVEPNTGVIIKGQEQVDRSLESDAGSVTLAKGTIGYTEASQKAIADEYGSAGSMLGFIKNTLPWLGLGLGALLTLAGLAILLTGRARRHQTEPATTRESRSVATDPDHVVRR